MTEQIIHQPHRILVVDDDKDMLRQFERVVRKRTGCDLVTLDSVSLAMDLLHEGGTFDLIVVDLRMKENGGTNLIQQLSSEGTVTQKLGVICGTLTKEEQGFLEEFDQLHPIPKPLSDDELFEHIRMILNGTTPASIEPTSSNLDPDFRVSEIQQMRIVQESVEKGDRTIAYEALRKFVAATPSSARLGVLLGEMLFEDGRTTEAQNILSRVRAKTPFYLPALNLLTRILARAGDFHEALRIMEIAQKLSPLNTQRLVAMGEIHLAHGRLQAAEQKFRRTLELCPEHDPARMGLARSLIEQGRTDQGRRILNSVKDPGIVLTELNLRGVLLVSLKRYDEGIELYKRAIMCLTSNKKEHALYYNLALAYARKGDVRAAIRAAETALKSMPGYERAVALLQKIRSGRLDMISASSIPKEFSERQMAFLTGKVRVTAEGDIRPRSYNQNVVTAIEYGNINRKRQRPRSLGLSA